MSDSYIRFVLVFAFAASFCLLPIKSTSAQTEVIWSSPIQITAPEDAAGAPALVADMAGNVHMMWSRALTPNPPPGEGDTLFYARWDVEHGWSQTVDVLAVPNTGAEVPDLAVTPDGTLHAVWGTGGTNSRMMYAHAPACCADNPRNWSQPIALGGPVLLTTSLVADDQGRLHAAFPSYQTRNIVYRRSDDGGLNWSEEVEVPGGADAVDELASYPRLAVDGRGRVHLVWSVGPWPGRRVMYARSEDGGDNWELPQEIDTYLREDYAEDYGPIFIDVEAVGEDQVHLIWDGAPTVERNHVWSSDGGKTWSERVILIPELTKVGRQGWNDMVADELGTVHVAAIGPYYANWSDGSWSNSTLIPGARSAELMRIALTHGNRLHVVWMDYEKADRKALWYAQGQTTAPEVAVQALPTPLPLAVQQLSATEAPGATLLASPTSIPQPVLIQYEAGASASAQPEPWVPIMAGVLPAILVISAAIWIAARRMR
jgi:hypothetical protein